MEYRENPTIAAIDDVNGWLSDIRESVTILALRWRNRKDTDAEADAEELIRIFDAVDCLQDCSLVIRSEASRQLVKDQGR